jgi:hypothetical protein
LALSNGISGIANETATLNTATQHIDNFCRKSISTPFLFQKDPTLP